jgi:hypothetical protein
MSDSRTRKMRSEAKMMEQTNREMEERLKEIKNLFEKEQGKYNTPTHLLSNSEKKSSNYYRK